MYGEEISKFCKRAHKVLRTGRLTGKENIVDRSAKKVETLVKYSGKLERYKDKPFKVKFYLNARLTLQMWV